MSGAAETVRSRSEYTMNDSDGMDMVFVSTQESHDLRKAQKIIDKLEEKLYLRRCGAKKVGAIETVITQMNEKIDEFIRQFNNRVETTSTAWKTQLQTAEENLKRQLRGETPRQAEKQQRESNSISGGQTNDTTSRVTRVERKMGDIERKVEAIYDLMLNMKSHSATPVKGPRPNIYGVSEIANIYEVAYNDVMKAIGSLKALQIVPAVYSASMNPGGLRAAEEIELPITVLQTFQEKLKKSLVDYEYHVDVDKSSCMVCGSHSSTVSDSSFGNFR